MNAWSSHICFIHASAPLQSVEAENSRGAILRWLLNDSSVGGHGGIYSMALKDK